MDESALVQLEYEQALRPFLVPRIQRGIIGQSRYAKRLRQQVRQASQQQAQALEQNRERRSPIFIFGEPGLNKDNLAALIHYTSVPQRQAPMIQIDCAKAWEVEALWGRSDRPGLLVALGSGSLLLNNVQDISPALKPNLLRLVQTGEYEGSDRPEKNTTPSPNATPNENLLPTTVTPWSPAWILMTAERAVSDFSQGATSIKVPPLRVRKADIELQVNYYLKGACRKTGQAKPRLTPEALRRLQSYDFPGNLTELESLVERAVVQADYAAILTADVFWSVESRAKRFRWNLLNAYPSLRNFLNGPWWPDRLNYGFTFGFYTLTVALLLWGPQTRDTNFALNLFWAWWWPLILLSFPFVGRLWCAVCPFMIYGEVVQWLSLKLWPRSLLPWPRRWADRWGGWLLWAGFALILLWEELWNLEDMAYLSAWLLILITAGAIICSLLFERRFWCRYLCPIGGMNGLFAKLSMVELRAQQGICSATCETYHCYKGGPAEGEGQATGGCPVYSHPAQLTDNRNCVLCMTCLKACPHRSVELNLRPPGIELWTTHQPSFSEIALLFLLAGAVLLHRLPELMGLAGLEPSLLDHFGLHAALSIIALTVPGAIALLVQTILQRQVCKIPFLTLAYGYLPLVLLASLAHYLDLGLTEGGQVIGVAGVTLQSISSLGASVTTWRWVAHPAVVTFLQGCTLCLGALVSLVLTQRLGRRSWRSLLPQQATILGLTALFWQVIL